QRLHGAPRGNMDHVEGDDCRSGCDWPRLIRDIQTQSRAYVRERLIFGPMRDRFQGVLVALTRLPGKIRHLPREMHNMLSRPAAHLKNKTLIRQYLLEYLGNGALVAFRRWTDEAVSGKAVRGFAAAH